MALWFRKSDSIGFSGNECSQSWVRADVSDSGLAVCVSASRYPELSPDDCRLLAAWLYRFADSVERQPSKAMSTVDTGGGYRVGQAK
jgi:hypothetical protein